METYLISCSNRDRDDVDGVRTAVQANEDLDLVAELPSSFILVRGPVTAVTHLPYVEYVEQTDRTTF